MTPSSSVINLLEQLIELKETFYFLDHQLMMKGYNPERAGWGRCTGQGVGKRAGSFHAPSKCDMFPSLQVHQSEALPLGFLWRFHSTCSVMCQLIVTLDCSLPGSSVQGISQARILEWVAISFSRWSSQPRDLTCLFCIVRQILYHWATWEVPLNKYK